VIVHGCVKKVYTENADGLLLARRVLVEQVRVDDHVGRVGERRRLEPNPDPSVAWCRE
jgi:hypothetical protein